LRGPMPGWAPEAVGKNLAKGSRCQGDRDPGLDQTDLSGSDSL